MPQTCSSRLSSRDLSTERRTEITGRTAFPVLERELEEVRAATRHEAALLKRAEQKARELEVTNKRLKAMELRDKERREERKRRSSGSDYSSGSDVCGEARRCCELFSPF